MNLPFDDGSVRLIEERRPLATCRSLGTGAIDEFVSSDSIRMLI
jgi:hypothetical protein